jgi:hypothetical protein
MCISHDLTIMVRNFHMYLNSNAHILTVHIHKSPPAQSHPVQGDDLSLLNDPV